MEENNGKSSRRNFLQFLGWASILGTIGGMIWASVRFMYPNILYEPPKSYKIGRPEEYLEGVTFLPKKKIFVVRHGDKFMALSAVCTHLGCTPNWIEERRRYECPCHGSIFDEKGVVISGPAPKPLPWYQVTLATQGRLYVNERRIVSFSDSFLV